MIGPQILSAFILLSGFIMMIMAAVGVSKAKQSKAPSSVKNTHVGNLVMSIFIMIAGAAGVALFSKEKVCKP